MRWSKFKALKCDWSQSHLRQYFRLGASKLSFIKDHTDYRNSRRQYHLQEKQQLPGFQDMHTEQIPNQDRDPSSVCKRIFTPFTGCVPQPGSTPYVRLCFPALPHIRTSHYTSQTQGHLLLHIFLLGSRSSHLHAKS